MIKRIFNISAKLADRQFSILNYKISGKDIFKHPLFTGSALMVFGSNFANFLAYIYHLILGRMLGPSSYGELAATLAAISLFSTAFIFLGTVVTKFVSAAKDEEEIKTYYKWFMNKALQLGIGMALVLLITSPLISNFLHLPFKTALLIGPILLFFLLITFFKSFLQGLLKFFNSVLLTNIEISLRLLLGLLLVYFGLSSFGGVLGIFLASVVSFLLGIYLLRKYRMVNKVMNFKYSKDILNYSIPIFIVSLANNSFISSDVIMAKHFFDSHNAGIYSSLSVLGKIIFYGTAPIISVMFPMISQKYSKGGDYKKVLILSFILTLAISFGVLLIYYVFPQRMILLLFGSKYLEGAHLLFWFGLFMFFYALANVIISFYLSIEKTKIVYIPCIFAGIQIIGITLMHKSLINIIQISVLCASMLFITLLIYLVYGQRDKLKKS